MHIPNDAEEITQGEPDYRKADGTSAHLLRVYATPAPPLAFTVAASGTLAREVEPQKPAWPTAREALIELGYEKASQLLTESEFNAEKIQKIVEIARVHRVYQEYAAILDGRAE